MLDDRYHHIGQPRGPLDATSWDERYRAGDTPWDRGEPSPGLVDFLARAKPQPGTVLVPGCGRGHDCRALADLGFHVTGLDVSPQALARAIPAGPTVRYEVGDFLTHAGQYDWIFEHTCFCAIHPGLRDEYVQAAVRNLKPRGYLLGIFFNIHAAEGPPFGATRAELWDRFAPHFDLREELVPRSFPNRTGEELLLWWQKKT